jgi:hypothetical protein
MHKDTNERNPLVIHQVPAKQVLVWLRLAWQQFKAFPFTWIVLFIIYASIQYLPNNNKFFEYLPLLFTPILSAVIYLAAAAGDRGSAPLGRHLTKVFDTPHLLRLLFAGIVTGAIFILCSLLLNVIASLFNIDTHEQVELIFSFFYSYPVASFIMVGLGGALFFYLCTVYTLIPALIIFHYLPVFSAIRLALAACLRNWRAVMFYALLWSVLFLLCLLALYFGLPGMVITVLSLLFLFTLSIIANFYLWESFFITSEPK